MRTLSLAGISIFVLTLFYSCKSSSVETPKSFCDTACLKDSMIFKGDHKLNPYVFITANDCRPDSVGWNYKGMGSIKKTSFDFKDIKVNKDFVRCFIRDTAMAYILLNDCITGRGYQILLPFAKNKNYGLRTSGINSFDKKFSIADNLLVNTDRGNIFIENMANGKKAMMTFGQKLDIDYDVIHEYIDSVNITNERVWVKILVDKKWVEKEKKLVFE
ncbi:MAG: hypothetical protein WBC06_14465 [Chitinophagaceae bacterium]